MVHESQVSFFWFDVTVGRGKERGGGVGGVGCVWEGGRCLGVSNALIARSVMACMKPMQQCSSAWCIPCAPDI